MSKAAVSKGIRDVNTESGYRMVDEYNAGLINAPTQNYFLISVGGKSAMFTLYRCYRPEGELPIHYNPFRFIRILSNNFNVAIEKALNFMGNSGLRLCIESDFTIEYDYSGDIFQFGKYKGRKISEIAEEDINYLIYMSHNKFEATSARIKENFVNIDNQVEAYFAAKREENRANSKSDYIGEEGSKVFDLCVKIVSVKIVENNEIGFRYAPKLICKIKAVDESDNVFKIDFNSGTSNYRSDYKKGEELYIKNARIKKNVEIMGIKTTVLNYVKM